MPRILRGLSSKVLACGCLLGIYETYEGSVIGLVDLKSASVRTRHTTAGPSYLQVDSVAGATRQPDITADRYNSTRTQAVPVTWAPRPSAEARHRMRFWFNRKKLEAPVEPPRPTCHGCQSNETEMVVPVSPEVLSYRCTQCGRQWSVRAHEKKRFDQTL